MKPIKGEVESVHEHVSLRLVVNDKALSNVDYSTHLCERSSSVKLMYILLEPMKELFDEKKYAPPFNMLAKQSQNQFLVPGDSTGDSTSADQHSREVMMAKQHNLQDSGSTENTTKDKHGESSSSSLNKSDAANDFTNEVPNATKTEVKEEALSTDEEATLFDMAEKSIS